MKKMIFLMSPDLQENGTLNMRLGSETALIASMLDDEWEISFLVRGVGEKIYAGVPEDVRLIIDGAMPDEICGECSSRIQAGMARWSKLPQVLEGEYDCAIVMGFDPWAIQTAASRLNARRKLIYMHRPIHHFIGEQDEVFFRELMQCYDGVLCADDEIAASAHKMLGDKLPVWKIEFPVDIQLLNKMASEETEVSFEAECKNIVAVYSHENEEQMEDVPALAAELKEAYPDLRWYVLGRSKLYGRLQRNIVLRDVWQEVIPINDVENVYPYIRRCDAYLQLPGDEYNALVRIAKAMHKDIIELKYSDQKLTMDRKVIRKADQCIQWTQWEDFESFNIIIKGE